MYLSCNNNIFCNCFLIFLCPTLSEMLTRPSTEMKATHGRKSNSFHASISIITFPGFIIFWGNIYTRVCIRHAWISLHCIFLCFSYFLDKALFLSLLSYGIVICAYLCMFFYVPLFNYFICMFPLVDPQNSSCPPWSIITYLFDCYMPMFGSQVRI